MRQLFTTNTETNEHMIGINETLGYRVLGQPPAWDAGRPGSVVEAQAA